MTSASSAPVEPVQAFPYKPPTDETRARYAALFLLDRPLAPRFLKMAFDKLVAFLLLLLATPVLLFLKLAYLVEGWLDPECKGPLVFHYNAISAGKVFPKYKIRLIKTQYIDAEGAARGDWHTFSAEWTPESRTRVGPLLARPDHSRPAQVREVLPEGGAVMGHQGSTQVLGSGLSSPLLPGCL